MPLTDHTLDPKSSHLLSNPAFHNKKAGTHDLVYAKEVFLDHAVEVYEKTRVRKKAKFFERLNAALYRSLKGFFDVYYK